MMELNQRPRITFILLAVTTTVCLLYISSINSNNVVECAPMTLTTNSKTTKNSNINNSNANKNNNNRLARPGLLSNLFRRQTPSSTSGGSSDDDEANEAKTQTEIDAQKFMDSLPNVGGSSNQGPSSFRERVSDTFGLLREGVNNQFRSLRDNFSETVEDLRDTWSSGQE